MKLTGKCKEMFYHWLETKNDEETGLLLSYDSVYFYDKYVFDEMPFGMQWVVLQDFADSVEFDLLCRKKDGRFISFTSPYYKTNSFHIDEHDTRQEARTAAIEKFNELYNQSKEK